MRDKSIIVKLEVDKRKYSRCIRICYIHGEPQAHGLAASSHPEDTMQISNLEVLDPDERTAVEEALDVIWYDIKDSIEHILYLRLQPTAN